MSETTFGAALADAARRLGAAGMENGSLDARLLMENACGYSHAQLISKSQESMGDALAREFERRVVRRLAGEPVQRIAGACEFYGRTFMVSPETLIPRQDTETLVDTVLMLAKEPCQPRRVLEIGTGTGCIAITLAMEIDACRVTATDVSAGALRTADRNAQAHDVTQRVNFLQSDLFDAVEGNYDLIVSNPPHIPHSELDTIRS